MAHSKTCGKNGTPFSEKNTVRIYETLILLITVSIQQTFCIFSCNSAHPMDLHESLSASDTQNTKPATYNGHLTC